MTNYKSNDNAKISFWDNKYFLVSIILTVIFVLSHIALLVFVQEKQGKFFLVISSKLEN